jgi:hypothetical protein
LANAPKEEASMTLEELEDYLKTFSVGDVVRSGALLMCTIRPEKEFDPRARKLADIRKPRYHPLALYTGLTYKAALDRYGLVSDSVKCRRFGYESSKVFTESVLNTAWRLRFARGAAFGWAS